MDESERGAAAVTESRQRRKATGDSGAAVVEMALVGSLLFLLLFGIITYGYMMSFKQNMTQAATEGARAGAVAPDPAQAQTLAFNAAKDATRAFRSGTACDGTDGLTCVATTATCTNKPGAQCVTVTVTYDYSGKPLLPQLPLFGAFMPNKLESSSTAEINSP